MVLLLAISVVTATLLLATLAPASVMAAMVML
jgi:hypothetical protein